MMVTFPAHSGQTSIIYHPVPLCRKAEDLEPLVRLLAGKNSHKLKSVKDVNISKLRVITIVPNVKSHL
ncbi:MAG: hypothetical protein U1E99_10855 [Agitococcus sp.]